MTTAYKILSRIDEWEAASMAANCLLRAADMENFVSIQPTMGNTDFYARLPFVSLGGSFRIDHDGTDPVELAKAAINLAAGYFGMDESSPSRRAGLRQAFIREAHDMIDATMASLAA